MNFSDLKSTKLRAVMLQTPLNKKKLNPESVRE
jgi:hypothetical protein